MAEQSIQGITPANRDPNAMDTSPGRTRARFTGQKKQHKNCKGQTTDGKDSLEIKGRSFVIDVKNQDT
jgi:hypothetical protein